MGYERADVERTTEPDGIEADMSRRVTILQRRHIIQSGLALIVLLSFTSVFFAPVEVYQTLIIALFTIILWLSLGIRRDAAALLSCQRELRNVRSGVQQIREGQLEQEQERVADVRRFDRIRRKVDRNTSWLRTIKSETQQNTQTLESVLKDWRNENASLCTKPEATKQAVDFTRSSVSASIGRRSPSYGVGNVGRPSFVHEFEAIKRIDSKVHHVDARHPVWRICDRLAAYDFAAAHGVRTPQIFGRWESLSAVAWEKLPNQFVLNCLGSDGRRTAYPIEQVNGEWRDIFTGHRHAVSDAPNSGALATSTLKTERVFAEELLGWGIKSVDIEFYCFYGVVGVAVIRDRRGKRHSSDDEKAIVTDATGGVLSDAKSQNVRPIQNEVPRSFGAMASAASRMSGAIPRPFARIDMLEREGQPLLRSITPSPVNMIDVWPELDEKLGTLWEDAEAKIQSNLVDREILELVLQ